MAARSTGLALAIALAIVLLVLLLVAACISLTGPCDLVVSAAASSTERRLECAQGGSALLVAPRQSLEAAAGLLHAASATSGP